MTLDFRLTPAQLARLDAVIRHAPEAAPLKKALGPVLVHRGVEIAEAASLLRISGRSIYRWMEELWGTGAAEWRHEPERGRPPRWNEEIESILEAALAHRPDQIGYARVHWTTPLLRAHLLRWS